MMRALLESEVPMELVDYDPFAGGELARVVASTESQREIWLADQLGTDASLSFNLSVSLRLRGDLDQDALARALQSLVDRHESLRASFDPQGERLCIRKPLPFAMATSDLSVLQGEAQREAVDARVRQSVDTPFNVAGDLLFRAGLLRLSPVEHQLLLSAHHAACDGWSWWVIVRELGALYAQHVGSSVQPLPPPDAYSAYAMAEAQVDPGRHGEDEAFWLARFADEVPVLDLPTDRPRPTRRSFASARVDHVLDAELTAALRRLGARRGASLFATLLAGFSTLLGRLAGQDSVVIGIPAAGQAAGGHATLVGHCVNTLPLRFHLDPDSGFGASIDAAQDVLLDALEHQRYTFGTLLKKLPIARDPGRMPLVSVMFNIDQALENEAQSFPGLELEFFDNPRSHDTFELFINAVQVNGALRLECQYNRDLFDQDTVRRWLAIYQGLLCAAVGDPSAAIGDANMLDSEDREVLAEWNSTVAAWPPQRTLPSLLQAQAIASPDRAALRFGDSVLTYAQLHARADRIANALRARGVCSGDLVGVCLERHPDLVAGLLAVLKAGAGYVPLDPAYPGERLRFMADDAGLALVLSEGELAQPLEWPRERQLLLDADAAEIGHAQVIAPEASEAAVTESSVAYVIYTSGSTGKPKGVQVPHGAVVNFLESMRQAPGLAADDRLLAVTTTSFDISVLELFLPLTVGAQIVLASRETAMDGEAIAAAIERDRIDVMQATPSTWHMLLDTGWRPCRPFRALCGGEALSPELATRLLDRGVELWNMYGPTETTVWSTCARVEVPALGTVPDIHVGRPIANTTVWVLDDRGKVCPPGIPGELCIGGAGVALGYLGRPELTDEKFFPDRVSPRDHGTGLPPRLYRTGDRGRWRPDGVLEHQGRIDFQVKVRGHRIELGEIESRLEADDSVARAVATTREDHPGDVRLVGYVVAAPGRVVDETTLFEGMRSALPPYMVPQHLVVLDAFPLLPNGKVDRKRLPAPALRRQAASALAGQPAAVRYLIGVWSDALGVDAAPGDNFFDIGGHSMLAVKMANRVQRETGVRLNLLMLASSTLAQIAEALPRDVGAAQADEENALPRMDAAPAGQVVGVAAPGLEPFHFGPSDRRLFGLYHAPPGKVRACVLVCPPLLHEHMRSYRFFAGIADRLAASGLACLRFDYFGTWDSGGASEDFHPARAGSDMALAAAALHERAGDVPLVLMGIRASAMFAQAQAQALEASALWLWQPVFDAGAYLRELDEFDAVERRSSTRYPFARKGPAADPGELMGFKLASTFREELLAVGESANAPETPTLVVGAATDDIADGARRIELPDVLADWTGQLELHGLIPLRSAAGAIEALVAESRKWD